MRELFRTNDAVRLSLAQALLRDAGIESVVLDHHTSLVEGSIGAIPRRLMVAERDYLARPRGHRRGRGGAAMTAMPDPTSLLPRTACSADASGCGSRLTARALRSIRCFSPPRCRRSRTSWCSTSAAARRGDAVPRGESAAIPRRRPRNAARPGPAGRRQRRAQRHGRARHGDHRRSAAAAAAAEPRHVRPCHGQPAVHRRAVAARRHPNPAKAAATIEGEADLADWVRFAIAMARDKGT